MESRARIRSRLEQPHDAGRYQQSEADADGNLPADDLLDEQPEPADGEEVADPLPAAATEVAHDRIGANLDGRRHVVQARLHYVERGGTADRIERNRIGQVAGQRECERLHDCQMLVVNVAHRRRDPEVQVHWESDQNDYVARHRRVEDVESKPPVQVLCNHDCEQCARCRHPPGCQRWQREGEQSSCDERTVVRKCGLGWTVAQEHHKRLAGNREDGGDEQVEYEARPEEPDMGERCRRERGQNL